MYFYASRSIKMSVFFLDCVLVW